MTVDKKWSGQWIAPLSYQRVETVNIVSTSNNYGYLNAIASTSTGIPSIGEDGVDKVQRRRSTDIVNAIFHKNANDTFQTIQIKDSMLKITPNSMTDFTNKYPILSKMLNIYLNFTKRRNDRYKRTEKTSTVQKIFNWRIYTQMDHHDMEAMLIFLADFLCFTELEESDKTALFKRFWNPFSFFERIYDTLNTLNPPTLDGNDLIMLQNGSVFDLDGLVAKASRKEATKIEKAVFETWKTLFSIIQKLEPHCIEIMYLFCCFLWNSSYLEKPLTESGEEIIRRGRLVIHREMREFYGYDDSQWDRIYLLRHALLVTEKNVEEYLKVI
jgi:hypothetical protein